MKRRDSAAIKGEGGGSLDLASGVKKESLGKGQVVPLCWRKERREARGGKGLGKGEKKTHT